mgnify:CR=1 FL=1
MDNNGEGSVDEGVTTTFYTDADGDGYGDAGDSIESCDPGSLCVADDVECEGRELGGGPDINENSDGLDNDGDDEVDEGVLSTFYRDADGDGYGDAETTTAACDVPADHVADATDCDDGSAARAPGLTEVCDGLDND